jgi:arylsulfatase A-like enzyme
MSLEKMVKDINSTITSVDENVGKVFAALTESGILDRTAMLFTSDNGFFHGEWKLYDKRLMHEPSIRVPLLVRYPARFKRSQSRDQMALNIDIAPTVLDLAGVAPPKWMHGRSLVPVMANPRARFRKDWLYEYFEYPDSHKVKPHRGIRTERWKLIHWHESPEEFELYDLKDDPGELKNLYGKPGHEGITRELTARIKALRKESGDVPLT